MVVPRRAAGVPGARHRGGGAVIYRRTGVGRAAGHAAERYGSESSRGGSWWRCSWAAWHSGGGGAAVPRPVPAGPAGVRQPAAARRTGPAAAEHPVPSWSWPRCTSRSCRSTSCRMFAIFIPGVRVPVPARAARAVRAHGVVPAPGRPEPVGAHGVRLRPELPPAVLQLPVAVREGQGRGGAGSAVGSGGVGGGRAAAAPRGGGAGFGRPAVPVGKTVGPGTGSRPP
ncbi:hypothetical protein QJS66_13175 [Kocuria rhizophila]|nr:hypothetical protein QJS66_13175 [Kocuria rhizophila]